MHNAETCKREVLAGVSLRVHAGEEQSTYFTYLESKNPCQNAITQTSEWQMGSNANSSSHFAASYMYTETPSCNSA